MDADGGDHRRLMNHTPSDSPDIEWSPDSQYLLFESNHLTAISADGSGRLDLTPPSAKSVPDATWSPDGRTVAFSRQNSQNIDIYKLDIESGQTTQLTAHPRVELAVAWSPDSQRLAFIRRGRTGGLFVMDADGMNVSRVIGGVFGEPAWSPDGQWIAVQDYDNHQERDIWVASPDGTKAANITHSRADELQFSWSPDSEQLVFANYYRGSISVIDRDGTDRREIFHRRSVGASFPVWSLDGERILFEADDILTIRPDGTGLRNLTPGPRAGLQPVYSPDGSSIAYLRN